MRAIFQKNTKQAGVELYQAQEKLGLAKLKGALHLIIFHLL